MREIPKKNTIHLLQLFDSHPPPLNIYKSPFAMTTITVSPPLEKITSSSKLPAKTTEFCGEVRSWGNQKFSTTGGECRPTLEAHMNHWRYLSENSSRPPRNIRPGYKCGFGFADHKQVVEGFLGMFQVCI